MQLRNTQLMPWTRFIYGFFALNALADQPLDGAYLCRLVWRVRGGVALVQSGARLAAVASAVSCTTLTPDVPVMGNTGQPPANRCLASRPGQFPPLDIHLGPGRHFALIARLGNWAEVLPQTQDYLLTVAAPPDAPTTGYRLFLTTEPLVTPTP